MADISPKIFTESDAQLFAKNAGAKYRPANGHEGDKFLFAWCWQCERSREFLNSEDGSAPCDIQMRSMAFAIDDMRYPSEWIIGTDGQPRCTAFVPLGEAIPESRCERTTDMFEVPGAPL